jgi:hypothetical protein
VKALNATVDHVKDELLPEVDFEKFDEEKKEILSSDNGNALESELKMGINLN